MDFIYLRMLQEEIAWKEVHLIYVDSILQSSFYSRSFHPEHLSILRDCRKLFIEALAF